MQAKLEAEGEDNLPKENLQVESQETSKATKMITTGNSIDFKVFSNRRTQT